MSNHPKRVPEWVPLGVHDVEHRIDWWRRCGGVGKIVFTNGTFDLLHVGHLSLLKRAAALGDRLIVGINSDESTKRYKGDGRPIIPDWQRWSLLMELHVVSMAFVFHGDTPCESIELLKPDVHVKGGDWKEEDLPEAKIVRGYGGEVQIIPITWETSTTKIIDRIRGGTS